MNAKILLSLIIVTTNLGLWARTFDVLKPDVAPELVRAAVSQLGGERPTYDPVCINMAQKTQQQQ